jgi:cytochrome c oxidase cbb3-type subunit I/II
VTVTVLHIFNNLEIPVHFMDSIPVFAGVQDALVQWWYGHNAVAFFLTTPYLGLMYYYLPKAANRPVFSYRLSIVHFWALIFIYIWAGPHHLLYTSLPNWAQSIGIVFSIMLIAPSWGGMLNGLLTLRGAWDRVRTDPILKFMVVAVTAYGMATFEGPMLSLKSFNAISHYTDWTIGHVHVGTLGWNGMLTFGILYWLIPRIYDTKLYSVKLANTHFWIGTLGILFYTIPLYWAGWTQSLMWKQFTPEGFLTYGNFLETVTQIIPMYIMRAVGGTIYLTGVIVMAYNLFKTVKAGSLISNEAVEAPAREIPVKHPGEHWHRWIERRPIQMLVFSAIAILIGGIIEIFPMMLIDDNVPKIESVKPYTALEWEGRDLYIREGCLGCHSQMIRPFRSETARYGDYSKSGEFIYDRPFLWGSKRTGPDLAREGVLPLKKSDAWHYKHLVDPREVSSGSIMPAYPFLAKNDLNTKYTKAKLKVLKQLGTPYTTEYIENAAAEMETQAKKIAKSLNREGIGGEGLEKKEIIALIAYLQRLGTDIKPDPQAGN